LTEDVLLNLNRMFLSVNITLGIPLRNGFLPGGLFPRRGKSSRLALSSRRFGRTWFVGRLV